MIKCYVCNLELDGRDQLHRVHKLDYKEFCEACYAIERHAPLIRAIPQPYIPIVYPYFEPQRYPTWEPGKVID